VSTRSLFLQFPALEGRVPWTPLCTLPTPVVRAEKLETELGVGPLWWKCDEQSAPLYGGNKPRKLEWILGDALARGRRRVITTGAYGTNHGLATALFARELGLACELVLAPQPVTDSVRARLLELAAAGAELHHARSMGHAVLCVVARLARHPRAVYVPTGGSNPRGVLGTIDAGLELAAQVREGVLPEPARVYVALGSGGSAAGLAAGLALGGLRTKVVAVLVTYRIPLPAVWATRLAQRALRLLVRAGADFDPRAVDVAGHLEIESRFVGPGYGVPTPAADRVVELAAGLEVATLERTYTGKALAALAERERGSREPVAFWNSYAGRLPVAPARVTRDALPPSFRSLFGTSA
jgi:D-cysteine desulfhydrase